MGRLQDLSSIYLGLFLTFQFPSVHAVNSAGCTVSPSNNSQALSWTDRVRFRLESEQIQLPSGVSLVPLAHSLVNLSSSQLAAFNVSGKLLNVDTSNSLGLNSSDIALISCDESAYPGELDASETVGNILTSQHTAEAIVLYSAESKYCNFTADEEITSQYRNVFTLLNSDHALSIRNQLSLGDQSGSTSILANMSMVTPSSPQSSGVSSDSPNTGSSSSRGNFESPSPTTAVAMIILYSITGIITALFLGIIITGAIRAHRHPERYGPRHTAGRPRQSRARGLARAMLETIPIVKFGDDHDGKVDAAKGDVEMAMANAEQGADNIPERRETTDTTTETEAIQNKKESNQDTQAAASPEPREKSHDPGNYMCPICTDDFVKGQDLRVLPCNHQFHPDCIDPWLVNVSGTCPLCRIDLNPAKPEDENEIGEAAENAEPSHETQAEPTPDTTQTTRQHRRLTTYLQDTLNVRRMRDATVEERLAALRDVRQVSRDHANAGGSSDEGQRRRNRLSTRFRERFRIHTRQHGEPASES